ncbi:MAG TPA: protein kinase [Opitutaceae bacterium]
MAGENDFDLGVTVRSFAAGQKLFGRYTLVRALGRGGMGVVWLARDADLERDVALKFLPEMVAADPVAIDDLKHETRRSLELTHPNIVRVHDFIQDDGIAAISMEFVKGRTLAEIRVDRPNRAFDVADITVWIQQICEALHYAHVHARVVHRDLKPANVMVDDRNRVKLTDFGISATVSDTVTRVSRLATTGGTAAYASPQQLMGELPCAADDIYALGATLYELLTSRPPFYTGNLLLQVQNRVPPSMTERRSELEVAGAAIPARWEEVVAAALSKNPADRPSTIEEFAHRLDLAGMFPAAPTSNGADDFSVTGAATIVSRGPDTGATKKPPPVPVPVKPPSGAISVAAPVPPAAPPPTTKLPLPVGDTPASAVFESVTPAPRRRSGMRWFLLVSLLVAAGLGLWLADVPNRVTASQLVKKGQRELVTADLDGAMHAFREALLRRPGDAAIRSELEATQEKWMDALTQRIASLDPAAALAQLEAAVEGARDSLVEPHAGEFRRLLAQARAAAREQTEREARREIEAALRKVDDGNVVAALSELDALAQRGTLVDEIAAARKSAAGRAARANVDRLAQAIRSGNARQLQDVLERASEKPAQEAAAAVGAVLGARTPEEFLAGIGNAGVQLASANSDTLPTDLALVEASRDRFSDAAATKSFLAKRYEEAARGFLDSSFPGFALYAGGLARAEGGNLDPRLEREARQELINELDCALHFAATEQAGGGGEAVVPPGAPRGAIRSLLDKKVGAWMKIVEMAPIGTSDTLVLKTRMAAIDTRDDASEVGDSVRYQVSTRTERNPEYERLAAELADARKQAADLEAQVANIERGGDSRGEAVLRGIVGFGLRMNAAQARQKADDLAAQLMQTPATVNTPVYQDEPFRRITHRVTYSTNFSATPALRDRSLAPEAVWSAESKHETAEVVGNASRGVPVQRASYPPMSTVATALGDGVAEKIKRDSGPLLRALVTASFARLDVRLKEAAASPAAVAGRRWGLLQFWQESGLTVPQAAEIESAVRGQLGLPEKIVAAEPPAPVAPVARVSEEKAVQQQQKQQQPRVTTYTVRQGDTIRSIAAALGLTPAELDAANPGIARRKLRPGQVLVVPAHAPAPR